MQSNKAASAFDVMGGRRCFKPCLLVQEVIDHLPVLALAGHREGRDSPVVGRVDVRPIVK